MRSAVLRQHVMIFFSCKPEITGTIPLRIRALRSKMKHQGLGHLIHPCIFPSITERDELLFEHLEFVKSNKHLLNIQEKLHG